VGGRAGRALSRQFLLWMFAWCLVVSATRASDVVRLDGEPVLVVPQEVALLRLNQGIPPDPLAWRRLPDSAFQRLEGRGVWLGWKSGHSLLRLPVVCRKPGRWWVLIDSPGLDSAQVEVNGICRGWIGENLRRSLWGGPWHGPWLALDLDSGSNVIHLHVVGNHGRLGLVLRLRSDIDQMRGAENEALRDGIFAGIFFANFLVALWLFVAVRNPAHFWYVIYQFLVLVFLFSIHHHAAAWLWPEIPVINQLDRTTTSLMVFGVIALFLHRLLGIENDRPVLGRILRWTGVVVTISGALQATYPLTPFFFEFFYQDNRVEFLEGGTYALTVGLVVLQAWHGKGPARWVLLAMLPMALALGVSVGAELFHIPWMYKWRGVVVETGLTLENVLLSLLLVHRLVRERSEHRELLERHLALELDFSRRLAQEADRNLRGTALDLHDGVGQELAGMSLYLRSVLRPLGRPELTDSVSREMGRVMESVRATAQRIYPPELMEGGLTLALERLAIRLASTGELQVSVVGKMSVATEQDALHWYRIVQEAVRNAQTHGRATRVEIELAPGRIEIRDNGLGVFQPVIEGMGMRTIRYRADQLGCAVQLRNGAQGTILAVGGANEPGGIVPGTTAAPAANS